MFDVLQMIVHSRHKTVPEDEDIDWEIESPAVRRFGKYCTIKKHTDRDATDTDMVK